MRRHEAGNRIILEQREDTLCPECHVRPVAVEVTVRKVVRPYSVGSVYYCVDCWHGVKKILDIATD